MASAQRDYLAGLPPELLSVASLIQEGRFKKAENLNFTLLADTNGDIAKAFGVPVSKGGAIKRTVEGTEHELVRELTTKRWTFIIGKDKKIIYKNESVNAEKDTEEVLSFIKLQASK